MLMILVTGLRGAGKSSVIACLERKKQLIFKADSSAREFLKPESPCYPQLKKLFGEAGLSSHGEFDRKKLTQLIFSSSEKRRAMEKIIHPLVRSAFEKFVQEQEKKGHKRVFYEVPLISKGVFSSFDYYILVTSSIENRKRRLMAKGWTEPEIQMFWQAQIPESEIIDKVDFIIKNDKDLKNLDLQVDKVLSLLDKKM